MAENSFAKFTSIMEEKFNRLYQPRLSSPNSDRFVFLDTKTTALHVLNTEQAKEVLKENS